jgi:hypothetical protein
MSFILIEMDTFFFFISLSANLFQPPKWRLTK